MATILAHITIREGHEAAFEKMARTIYADTHEHETQVNSYQYWRGQEQRTYYTLLAFEDHHAFIGHQVSDHHEDLSAGLRDAIEDMTLEWVDPIDGASPWPATEHQPAQDDASDLTKKYTDLYCAAVAAWWAPMRSSQA